MPRKIMEVKELTALIGQIGKRKVALDKNIQTAASQSVYQSIVHRNATPAMQLFEAMEGPMRRDALVAYFEKFGNLAWLKADKKLTFFDAKLNAESLTDEYVEQVETTLWHSTKKEPKPVSQYDLESEFDKVLDRLSKVTNKPGNEVKHKGLLDVMTAAFRRYQFEQVRLQTADTTTADNTIDPTDVNHPEFKGQAPKVAKAA